MNLLDLLKECSIRLIYLGNQRFGVLTWRLRLPKKVASKSPRFNIVEEYTLDDDINSTKQVINTNKVSSDVAGNVTGGGDGRVASTQQTITNYPVKETAEIKPEVRKSGNAKSLHLTIVARLAETTEAEWTTPTMPPTTPVITIPHPGTCPEDGIILSHYPWKSKPEVHLRKVSEIESDIWCNRVVDY